MKTHTLLALASVGAMLASAPAFATDDTTTDANGMHHTHKMRKTHGDSETGATDTKHMNTGTAASTGASSGQSTGSTHMGAGRNSGDDSSDNDNDE